MEGHIYIFLLAYDKEIIGKYVSFPSKSQFQSYHSNKYNKVGSFNVTFIYHITPL